MHYERPGLKVRTSSDGYQTLTTEAPISAGEIVCIWGGAVITEDVARSLSPEDRRYTMQIEERLFVLTTVAQKSGPDFINHSCEPNCGLDGQLLLRAMRDIEAGEEITCDYAISESTDLHSFNCLCGSDRCRGTITGEDWRREDVRERYSGWMSPYLARKIENGGRANPSENIPALQSQTARFQMHFETSGIDMLQEADGYRHAIAARKISAGEVVYVWGGTVIHLDQVAALAEEEQHMCLQIGEWLYIYGGPERMGPDFANHSCEPNCGLDGQTVLRAMRDIEPGERVTWEYATSESGSRYWFACRCESASCRGTFTGNDWQLPEIQARYRGWISPYLVRKMTQAAS